MASIYEKAGSGWLWIRYKDATGKWRGKQTEYRKGNLGELRQAKLLARKQSEIEQTRVTTRGRALEEWVVPWLNLKYGTAESTLDQYKRRWRAVGRYLSAHDLHFANQIKRDFPEGYLAWRSKTAGRNCAIQEIKMLGMILDEAIARDLLTTNPLRKLGLKKDRSPGKVIWSDEAIMKTAAHIEKTGCHWQQVTFYMGLFQACRLRQCQIPLDRIRLDLGTIQYPDIIVKGGQAFTQPIDPRFRPILERLIALAKREKLDRLCVVTQFASLTWRATLDRVGFPDLVHHGLRATWITRAAESKVSESLAMAFAHHSSAEVHRIYKKVSSAALADVPASVSFPALF